MEYLTTHDLVWINTTITGTPNPYNYVTLEAAMAAQYRYGQSDDVLGQAASLLGRLIAERPFLNGNVRTAFIATLTFLNANGYAARVDDAAAAQIVSAVASRDLMPVQAVADLAAPAEQPLDGSVTLRKLIAYECNAHTDALAALAQGD